MAHFCIDEIKAAAKKLFDNDSADALARELEDRATSIQAESATSRDDAFRQAADEIKTEKLTELQLAERNLYDNIARQNNLVSQVNSYLTQKNSTTERGFKKFFKEGIISLLDGTNDNVKKKIASTAAIERSNAYNALNTFFVDIKKNDVYQTFIDPKNSAEIANEQMLRGTSTNPKIVKLVDIIKENQLRGIKNVNKYGGDINPRSDYIISQVHDAELMLQTADTVVERRRIRKSADGNLNKLFELSFERWRGTIEPLLDPIKTLKGESSDTFFRSAYEAMTSNLRKSAEKEDWGDVIANLDEPEETIKELKNKLAAAQFSRNKSFIKKFEEGRLFHFRDGESFLKYNEIYGRKDLRGAIIEGLKQMGEKSAVLQLWGRDPMGMYKKVMKKILLQNRSKARFAKGALRAGENTLRDIMGFTRTPNSFGMANVSRNIRSFNDLRMMGGVILSALPDIVPKAATLRFNGVGLFDAYYESLIDLSRRYTKKEYAQIADLIGASSESILHDMTYRFTSTDAPKGMMSKMQQMIFKVQGMQAWDKIHRVGVKMTLARRLAQQKNLPFKSLNKRLKNVLGNYGIDEPEWDLVRKSLVKNTKNKEFIVPDASAEISDDVLKDYIAKKQIEILSEKLDPKVEQGLITKEERDTLLAKPIKIRKSSFQDVRDSINQKLNAYFVDQADSSILSTRPRDTQILLQGTQSGTIEGEALRFIAQYKIYATSFTRRIVMREINGTYDGKADLVGLAHLMVGATLFGYLTLSTKNIIAGFLPPNPSESTGKAFQIMRQSLERGGGLGIMGDMLLGDYNQFGHGFLESLAGPTLGSAADIFKLESILANGDDPRATALRFAKGLIPFNNLLFTKFALNYFFLWGIQEELSPGYLRRITRGAQKRGSPYFIAPTSAVRF